MAKILSQEEVDALLSEFSGEEAAGPAAFPGTAPAVKEAPLKKKKGKEKKVSLYNFRRPDRVSREQLRSLYYLHDRFARGFSSSLSTYLRALIDVNLYSVEQFTYGEFILSLSDPSYFSIISLDPLEGHAVLEISPKILFPLIDKILGGKGEDFGPGIRTVTEIEKTLLEGVVKLVLRDLEESWKPVIKLKMAVAAVETSPQLIQVVVPNEIVVLIVFELKVGEARGFMNLCIPAAALEPTAGRFSRHRYTDRAKTGGEEVKKIKLNLLNTRMKLEAGIYGNFITVKDLLEIKPGDLIRLETKTADDIHINVNGIKKYSACRVKTDRKKTVRIVNLIPREFKDE
jgi:flagellar motor switch protein FliM